MRFGWMAAIAMCLSATLASAQTTQTTQTTRHLQFNGRPLDASGRAKLEKIEQQLGLHLRDGNYWYDAKTGAFGAWGGPTVAWIPAGLDLGGQMPANCSGGGTRVFINGREIHPLDFLGLQQWIGQVYPGRYWVDAQGNAGYEGGPMRWNLVALAQANAAQPRNGSGYANGNQSNSGGQVVTGRWGGNYVHTSPVMTSVKIGSHYIDWYPGK